jgi:hypothetical protein
MTTRLTRLTQKVRELRGERLTSLMGMLFDPEGLRSSFERQEERKASGVDGVRKADYRKVWRNGFRSYPDDSGVWAIGPSRRGGYIFRRGRVDTDRWGFPALRTGWCRIGLAKSCRRSGSRSSVSVHMDFGPTGVPMMR